MVYTIMSDEGYSRLVSPKIVNGIEAYLVLRSPIVPRNNSQEANILVINHGHRKSISIKIFIVDPRNEKKLAFESSYELLDKEMKILPSEPIRLDIGEDLGEYLVELYVNDDKVDKTTFIVADPSIREPFYFTIVWHHHQAPNYMPDGKIHSPWAYVYVWGGYLAPYGYGPYHYHALLLDNKREFKATYNLSPSLLAQWLIAIEKGIETISGEKYDSSSFEVMKVKEALEKYRDALYRGQIDVLTSLYAHTIAGFLVDVLDAGDIVDEELSYGKTLTKKAMGNNYEALGVWTPEMAFSMGLIHIYRANGIEYTILDDKHHFYHAEGDKNSPYEPYLALNTATGDYITVFFRDHGLSNIMSFQNNFSNEYNAWRNAYEFSLMIARKWFNKNIQTLVLALDGENWMVFPRNPPYTAVFLDKLSDYLINMSRHGFIKLSHLREIYEKVPARRVLKYIPTNTWLGTFRKWRGEKEDHEKYWIEVAKRYRMIRAYERMIGGRDSKSRKARWALWHVLDSDYWWAEFWSPMIIKTWLREFDSVLKPILRLIKINNIGVSGDPVEGLEAKASIEITNDFEKDIRIAIRIGGLGIEVLGSGSIKPLVIKAKNKYSRDIRIKFLQWGKAIISAALTIDGYLIDSKSIEIDVKPYIRPNPV